jgi:predicted RNase H-like nuclease
MIVTGVDGCKAGWFAISKDLETGRVAWRICARVDELFLSELPPTVIGIDIPIGLPERGARACDVQARQKLGRGRGSSVFPAPIRPVLENSSSYQEACQARFEIEGKKISRQAWGIYPKIAEVDDVLRANAVWRAILREVHPEISFYLLAGCHPMQSSKKTPSGKLERRALLEPSFGAALAEAVAARKRSRCVEDDILDAFAVLWSAERIASGASIMLPNEPPLDSVGLRMEING